MFANWTIDGAQHCFNKNWYSRQKCGFLRNTQHLLYSKKYKCISSPEQNYFSHFAMRYSVVSNLLVCAHTCGCGNQYAIACDSLDVRKQSHTLRCGKMCAMSVRVRLKIHFFLMTIRQSNQGYGYKSNASKQHESCSVFLQSQYLAMYCDCKIFYASVVSIMKSRTYGKKLFWQIGKVLTLCSTVQCCRFWIRHTPWNKFM